MKIYTLRVLDIRNKTEDLFTMSFKQRELNETHCNYIANVIREYLNS